MDNIQPPSPQLQTLTLETFMRETLVNGQKVYKTYIDISKLKRDPQNPKDISDEKHTDLCDFLERYDQLMPLLVDARPEKLGQLIGGNHTLEGLKEIGRTEAWIEFRTPTDDADAFIIATLHNQQFSHYVEGKLKDQIRKYEDSLQEEIDKLEVALQAPSTFEEVLKPNPLGKMKYEIIIKCTDEADIIRKMEALNAAGIQAKKRGK